MNPLKFNLGEESRPKIETNVDIESSLFKDQYLKVFQMINNYIDEVDQSSENQKIAKESPNNIFAFIGERGSGKTSCMLSVASLLSDKKVKKEYFGKYDKTFLLSDNIDPSFFDQKHNILEVVISKLFINFKNEVEDTNKRTNADYQRIKRNLIEKFQQTRENLSHLLSNDAIISEDGLEQLIDMAAGSDLQRSMRELVDAYLEFFGKNMLVIPIDDVDLHTQHAYTMVEQIRKYLIHSNVVILLAVKLDQLALVIKLQYVKEFEKLLGGQKDPLPMESIEEMVDRYIGKLIPLAQRIYLPDTSVYFDYPLTVYNSETKNEHTYNSVQEAVTTLIFKKTRFLFYNSKGSTSYIVPCYLRELRHLVFLLESMLDWDECESEYNKTIFKKYFFEIWTMNNLDANGRQIIKNIIRTTDATIFNKMVISLLKERFKETVKDIDAMKPAIELSYILKDSNATYNISIGDVISYIQYIEKTSLNDFDRKLLFMIKAIYSMRLYEYYDQITHENLNEKPLVGVKIFKKDFMSEYTNFDKIVGGNFINSVVSDILPKEGIQERARRVVNIVEIRKIMSHLLSNNANNLHIQILTKKISRNEALNIVEFFVLTSSRRCNTKDDSTDKSYRVGKEIYYSEDFGKNIENVYFDITSVFYNATILKRTYDRFDPSLWDMANKTEDSILGQLTKKLAQRGGVKMKNITEYYNRWLSWATIRNIEILEDLLLRLEYDKLRSSHGGGNKAIVADFFEKASAYEIMTYDRNGSNTPYTIDFNFLEILSKVVKNMDDSIFGLLFNKSSNSMNLIDVNQFVNGMRRDGNRTKTIKRRLFENYSSLSSNPVFQTSISNLFDNRAYTKEEVIDKLNELNAKLNG